MHFVDSESLVKLHALQHVWKQLLRLRGLVKLRLVLPKLDHLLQLLLGYHHAVDLLLVGWQVVDHHVLLRLVILSIWVVVFVHAKHALVEVWLALHHAVVHVGRLATLPFG